MSEWLSTREVAKRLGYSHLSHLRKQLDALGVKFRRLTPRSPLRWDWGDVEKRIVPRGTLSQSESNGVTR